MIEQTPDWKEVSCAYSVRFLLRSSFYWVVSSASPESASQSYSSRSSIVGLSPGAFFRQALTNICAWKVHLVLKRR